MYDDQNKLDIYKNLISSIYPKIPGIDDVNYNKSTLPYTPIAGIDLPTNDQINSNESLMSIGTPSSVLEENNIVSSPYTKENNIKSYYNTGKPLDLSALDNQMKKYRELANRSSEQLADASKRTAQSQMLSGMLNAGNTIGQGISMIGQSVTPKMPQAELGVTDFQKQIAPQLETNLKTEKDLLDTEEKKAALKQRDDELRLVKMAKAQQDLENKKEKELEKGDKNAFSDQSKLFRDATEKTYNIKLPEVSEAELKKNVRSYLTRATVQRESAIKRINEGMKQFAGLSGSVRSPFNTDFMQLERIEKLKPLLEDVKRYFKTNGKEGISPNDLINQETATDLTTILQYGGKPAVTQIHEITKGNESVQSSLNRWINYTTGDIKPTITEKQFNQIYDLSNRLFDVTRKQSDPKAKQIFDMVTKELDFAPDYKDTVKNVFSTGTMSNDYLKKMVNTENTTQSMENTKFSSNPQEAKIQQALTNQFVNIKLDNGLTKRIPIEQLEYVKNKLNEKNLNYKIL